MPVALASMRDLLMPGLMSLRYDHVSIALGYTITRENFVTTPAAPHVWVPKLSITEAIIVGAAATIIANPTVTRRFWAGWKL